MSVSVSPFDLYLGDIASLQGYRCRTLSRDSAGFVAPRFSSGEQGQSDLDLLKSVSVDDFSGGMFQRDWLDSRMAARVIGIYNRADQKLYPVPPISSSTNVSANFYPVAKVEGEMYSFMAYGNFSAGTYTNLLYMMTFGGGYASITLPAALASNGFANITDLGLHKGFLYVSSQNGAGAQANYRYNIVNNTWLSMGGSGVLMRSMRGVLYHINKQSMIFAMTNEIGVTAATYTLIDYVGYSDINSTPTSAEEYNGALWISKPDGIYRFDGVKATKVLDLVTGQLKAYNGALYFVAGQWLYKFDGATVTKLQWFGSATNGENAGPAYGPVMSLSANSDYLFVATVVLSSGYTDGDKVPPTASGLRRIYSYDGAAFSMLQETAITIGSAYNPVLITNKNKLYDIFGTNGGSWQTTWAYYDLTKLFVSTDVTSGSKMEITTSEHDAGFPNILKTLELIDLSYTGMISGDSAVVSYQLFDGKTWGSWQTLGTITSTTPNTLEVFNSLPKLYRRVKFNVVFTFNANSTLALKGVSMRYTLQPRMRWRWQVTLMAQGNSSVSDRNDTAITTDSNALTNNVIKAIKQKTPIFMLSPDFGAVKSQINSAALSFIVKGQAPVYTDPYSEYPLVAVKNNNAVWEVLRVSSATYDQGNDETTITVLERGYQGVTAAQINAGAEWHLCYKVYVTRLLRDAPTLDINTYAEQDPSGESQLKRDYLIEITEV